MYLHESLWLGKSMHKQVLMDIQKVDKEWNAVIISYINPVGFYVSSRIGENPNAIHNNLIHYICQEVVGKELAFGIWK